mgnify:CR=1 FL=1
MLPDTFQLAVSRLLALLEENPVKTMDELEFLVGCTSVHDLAEILRAVYPEISDATGIDWHFTVLQWKLGNRGREQFLDTCRQARFTVWTLAFRREDGASEMRYTTCLPLCFKPEWKPCYTKVGETSI